MCSFLTTPERCSGHCFTKKGCGRRFYNGSIRYWWHYL